MHKSNQTAYHFLLFILKLLILSIHSTKKVHALPMKTCTFCNNINSNLNSKKTT